MSFLFSYFYLEGILSIYKLSSTILQKKLKETLNMKEPIYS
ncbi:hypothetical protein B4153_5911 [Bacillus cereus]|nr:hypothetical protein B4153_5911 [Bacillus cereus]